jgi:hypothetical protein
VNQPEAMHGSRTGTGYKQGRARYANAVYTYRPDFASGAYREGVVEENDGQVTFEFYTPYIIGATPPNDKPWGVYDVGGRNGLVLRGKAGCPVSISVDQGRTWQECGTFADGLDLTDRVKGRRQYFLRFGAGAKALAGSGITIATVCQANGAILPRLKDGGARVTFAASHRGIVSAGPNLEQAKTRIVSGGFGTPKVTLGLAAPRQHSVIAIYASGQISSSNPPSPDVKYRIEYSVDAGKTWNSMVKDWSVPRRGEEPKDFWSQSFCYGSAEISETTPVSAVQVRFANDGGKQYLRAEAHLVYRTPAGDGTKVTFDWSDSMGAHRESRVFAPGAAAPWELKTAKAVQTRWVEMEAVAK